MWWCSWQPSSDAAREVASPDRDESAPVALVLEQGDDGVRPVGDVVARLGVADRLEAHQQRVELLVAEPVRGFGGDRHALRLRFARLGEADEPLAAPGDLRELLEQLVDAPVALRLQG